MSETYRVIRINGAGRKQEIARGLSAEQAVDLKSKELEAQRSQPGGSGQIKIQKTS